MNATLSCAYTDDSHSEREPIPCIHPDQPESAVSD